MYLGRVLRLLGPRSCFLWGLDSPVSDEETVYDVDDSAAEQRVKVRVIVFRMLGERARNATSIYSVFVNGPSTESRKINRHVVPLRHNVPSYRHVRVNVMRHRRGVVK